MPWHTYLTTLSDRAALVLLDDQFARQAPVQGVPHLFWIGVWCRLQPGNSFWNPQEEDALNRLEKDMLSLCEQHAHGWAIYVRCVHTRGMREFYFYAGDLAELGSVAPQLKLRHPDYRIEFDRTSDPEWTHYRQWLAEPREPLPTS